MAAASFARIFFRNAINIGLPIVECPGLVNRVKECEKLKINLEEGAITLRDGMQGTGINFTLADKLQIARELDKLGIDYIEDGFPLANKKEAEFFNRLKQESFKHAKIVAFGSTRQPNMKAENDPHIDALLQTEIPAVTVVGKTWKAHVELVLQTSLQRT